MPPQTENPPARRSWSVFKTVGGRLSFVVASMAVLPIAAATYGIVEFAEAYGDKIEPSDTLFRIAVVTALLTLAVVAISRALGWFLITRKIKKFARVASALIDGKARPESLPSGLGELDGITDTVANLATALRAAQENVEARVQNRTSVLELSKGVSELEKARTDAVLDSIGEGVVATDMEGKVTFMNAVAIDALWWNPSAAMGVPIHSAFRLEDEKENVVDEKQWPTAAVRAEKKKVVTSAPTKPYYVRRSDKSRFPAKLTITPLFIENEMVGMLVIVSDITIEVDFDRRKSEFISIASHQLRSPATAIKGMTDMLRGGEFGPLNDVQKDWMGKLFDASDTMLNLVTELLNISKLEAGSELERVPQDLAAFAQNAMKQTEPLLVAKKQTFAFAQNATPRPAFDQLMIGEVMKNFISNANKYSPENGTITVAVDATDAEAKFSVTDQGMGIPKSDHAQMFNKFFRAENARKSPTIGTGLGLYYCKTVVEKHGGRVGFDSEVGKGSTFWFTLPLGAKT